MVALHSAADIFICCIYVICFSSLLRQKEADVESLQNSSLPQSVNEPAERRSSEGAQGQDSTSLCINISAATSLKLGDSYLTGKSSH